MCRVIAFDALMSYLRFALTKAGKPAGNALEELLLSKQAQQHGVLYQ